MTDDPINPAYYALMELPPNEVARSWELNFALGNCIKYIGRAGRKDPSKYLEDLQKAAWYLNDEIEWTARHKAATDIITTSTQVHYVPKSK